MKTARKAILLVMCAVLLVAASVMGTLAYFTDSEAVTNTFTVGKVYITLDEKDTDNDIVKNDNVTINGEIRDKANEYHLIPGSSYTKDPTVHIEDGSESCWVFVRVENGIADIEDSANTIAKQIESNGWEILDATKAPGVYYKAWEKGTDKDLEVFQSFKIAGEGVLNGTKPTGYTGTDEFIGDYANAKVTVTAYAIQMAGFENKQTDAWNALQDQLN